jgi:hypothetical protein
MRSFDAPCTPNDAMTANVSLLNSPARAAVVSRVDGAGDAGTPRRAEAPSLVLLGDARRRGVLVFFQYRGEVHGLLAEQRGPAVARVALRLAAVVVGGGRAQVPQKGATVTAAVSHQRLRPVRSSDARGENATRPALLGEAPQGARPQRCGGVPCEKHACSSSDDVYG